LIGEKLLDDKKFFEKISLVKFLLHSALADAAFGDHPGLRPLPMAKTPYERWLRAVALTGQGRYNEAAENSKPLRGPNHPVELQSAALSLDASMLRQQGDHARALELDTRSLALLPPQSGSESPELALARCDAVTGIAADHLGLGSCETAQAALADVAALVDQAAAAGFGWRARIRWHWVTAETAMAIGDFDGALIAARNNHDLARPCPSLRHRVKSQLVLAAAQFLAQGAGSAQACANTVFHEAKIGGLAPLAWAAAMLLHAIEPEKGWAASAAALRGQWR
jgi:tetratricopeptide (TPR) repeat protein